MFNIEGEGFNEAARQLSLMPGAVEKAAKTAVRKTLKGGRQDASRKVKERYTIKVSEVTKTIRVNIHGMDGELVSRGGRTLLEQFKHTPKRAPMKGRYLYAQVVKGEGGTLKHAFVNKSGAAYERTTAKRFPIRRLTSPSAPGMMGNIHVAPEITRKMQERLQVNLMHEVNAFLQGYRR